MGIVPYSDISCLYHSYALGVYCPLAIISLVWSPTGGQITWGEKSHLICSVCTELRKVQSTSDQTSTEFLGNLCPSLKHTQQITPGLAQAFSITPSAPWLWPSSLIYYYVSSPSASCPKTKVRILNPDPVVPAVAHHADSSFRTKASFPRGWECCRWWLSAEVWSINFPWPRRATFPQVTLLPEEVKMWSINALASRWFNSETFPQLKNSLWVCLSSLFQLQCSLTPPLPNFILVPSQVRFLRAFCNEFPACKFVHHHLFPREPVLSQILHKNKGKINNAHSKRDWGGLSQLTPNQSDLAMGANTWQWTQPPAWPSHARELTCGHLRPLHQYYPLKLSLMRDIFHTFTIYYNSH